jgi:hypothetical protein
VGARGQGARRILRLRHAGTLLADHAQRRAHVLFYRVNAIQKRDSLGRFPSVSLADAREIARAAQFSVAKGNDPAADKKAARQVATFADLAGLYLERHAKRTKKSWRDDERTLKAELLPRWKNVPVVGVSRRDVRSALEAIVERGAPIMANRVRALISKIYNWGVQNEIVEANPVLGVARPSRERARERVLTKDDSPFLARVPAFRTTPMRSGCFPRQ